MIERAIDTDERHTFLETFSSLYRGAIVTLRVAGRVAARDQPFGGVSDAGHGVVLLTGDGKETPRLGYRVSDVSAVTLEQTDDGADAAIAITSTDGSRSEIRLRSPFHRELLDSRVE